MKISELKQELINLVPEMFEDTDKKEFEELKKLGLPREINDLYKGTSPNERIQVGRFIMLPIDDLINENVWDAPGEDLFAKGFAVAGMADDGNYYCLDLNKTNKLGFNDVLLAENSKDYASIPDKDIRQQLVQINASFAGFLEKEIKFMKKSHKSRLSGA